MPTDSHPLHVRPNMLIGALTSIVEYYGAETLNADRHNTGNAGALSQYVAAELGVDWREIHAAEHLIDYVDESVTEGAPLLLTPLARKMWQELDDLAELGWEWGAILDSLEMDLPQEWREVPF